MTYHSTNSAAKSRGVSILISSKVPWMCLDTITDPNGRFLFLKGMIGGIRVTLANFYVPSSHQDLFTCRNFEKLLEFAECQLILGGDFNVPLIPSEDTFSGFSSVSPGSCKHIAQSLHRAQLVNVWCLLHSDKRNYTFYSSPHKLYSPIDYFLILHSQLHAVWDSSIGSITWSDHAPVTLCYALTDALTSKTKMWRLNESLLQDREVLTDVTRELDFYFQTNDTSGKNTF